MKRITTIIRDCIYGAGGIAYALIRVVLHPDSSGRSIRSGAINFCKYMGATIEQIILRSGHEMAQFSSLFEYYFITEWDSIPGTFELDSVNNG